MPPERTGEAAASTATTLISLFFSFKNLPVPDTVPPEPTADTKMSTLPSVSLKISGPVVS